MNPRLIQFLMLSAIVVAGQESAPFVYRGPFYAEASEVFLPGAVKAQVFVLGNVNSDVFAAGQGATQVL